MGDQQLHTKSKSVSNVHYGNAYVVVQFSPWLKFSFLLFLGTVIYDNEFEIKEIKIELIIKMSHNTSKYNQINHKQENSHQPLQPYSDDSNQPHT